MHARARNRKSCLKLYVLTSVISRLNDLKVSRDILFCSFSDYFLEEKDYFSHQSSTSFNINMTTGVCVHFDSVRDYECLQWLYLRATVTKKRDSFSQPPPTYSRFPFVGGTEQDT